MKRALVTGAGGQDGSYLCELLLWKGYDVHALVRRHSCVGEPRLEHLYTNPHDPAGRLHLHYGDLLDPSGLCAVLARVKPDEVYNLAAQSHVRVSFDQPAYTAQVVGVGAINLFEAVMQLRAGVRVYQASSSEMFGASPPPQCESTPFKPCSPYAVAKVMAHHAACNYRERGLFVANGILFNHESERRDERFVTRKITRAVARMKYGLQDKLHLGNLNARRDWGHARDYVNAMWLMLQQDQPDDYVIATGEMNSVEAFLSLAFDEAGVDDAGRVVIDERYKRPTEVDALCGDASKASERLGWTPAVDFAGLVRCMVKHDLGLAAREKMMEAA